MCVPKAVIHVMILEQGWRRGLGQPVAWPVSLQLPATGRAVASSRQVLDPSCDQKGGRCFIVTLVLYLPKGMGPSFSVALIAGPVVLMTEARPASRPKPSSHQ
jgi:hypothetical protein